MEQNQKEPQMRGKEYERRNKNFLSLRCFVFFEFNTTKSNYYNFMASVRRIKSIFCPAYFIFRTKTRLNLKKENYFCKINQRNKKINYFWSVRTRQLFDMYLTNYFYYGFIKNHFQKLILCLTR